MNDTQYKKVKVKTWYLKYAKNIPVFRESDHFSKWLNPDSEEYLNLYKEVGSQWGWTGHLLLLEQELKEKLNAKDNEIWLFQHLGKTIGFFEIDFSLEGKAEIVYLGLIPSEVGKGHGKELLNTAIAVAGKGGNTVWLHTCEYDHSNALNIYLQAGFNIVDVKIEKEYYPVEFSMKKD